MSLHVIKPTAAPARQPLPDELRQLADDIEAGKHDQAITLLWVLDCGDGVVTTGLMGETNGRFSATTAYFLAGVVQRKIEGNIGK